MYASRASTTQMLGSLLNRSNSKIGRGFPGFLVFVGFDIIETIFTLRLYQIINIQVLYF